MVDGEEKEEGEEEEEEGGRFVIRCASPSSSSSSSSSFLVRSADSICNKPCISSSLSCGFFSFLMVVRCNKVVNRRPRSEPRGFSEHSRKVPVSVILSLSPSASPFLFPSPSDSSRTRTPRIRGEASTYLPCRFCDACFRPGPGARSGTVFEVGSGIDFRLGFWYRVLPYGVGRTEETSGPRTSNLESLWVRVRLFVLFCFGLFVTQSSFSRLRLRLRAGMTGRLHAWTGKQAWKLVVTRLQSPFR